MNEQIGKETRKVFRSARLAIAFVLLLGAGTTRAVQIENVTVARRDARTAIVRFDISWTNSWRHEANHDAAWVFFKVQTEGATEWQHVRLAADKVLNPTGYGQEKGGTPLDFIVPDGADGFTGMFVRRAEYGMGNVAATKVAAVCDFAANKEIRLGAGHKLGAGLPTPPKRSTAGLPRSGRPAVDSVARSETGHSADTKVSVRAFGIEMVFVPEGPFYLGSGGTEPYHFYRYTDGTQHTRPYQVTSAGAIPTGRQAGKLWARRGAQPEDNSELPAAFPNGYAAFYCMKGHVMGHYAGFVNALTPAQEAEHSAALAGINKHGGLSWADGAAFAAWAALRPMTELEYEKVTRGPMEPGWDTGDTLDHPSYWEVQSINGWRLPIERAVTVGHAKGRGFKGTHGRGTLALPADWPQENAVGAGIRGGFGAAGCPSYRLQAATVAPDRVPGYGWRGVRTAPKGVGL